MIGITTNIFIPELIRELVVLYEVILIILALFKTVTRWIKKTVFKQRYEDLVEPWKKILKVELIGMFLGRPLFMLCVAYFYRDEFFWYYEWLGYRYYSHKWMRNLVNKQQKNWENTVRTIIWWWFLLLFFPISLIVYLLWEKNGRYSATTLKTYISKIKKVFGKDESSASKTSSGIYSSYNSTFYTNYASTSSAGIYSHYKPNTSYYNREEREYYGSDYYKATRKPFSNVEDDKGANGEYLIWKELAPLGKNTYKPRNVKFLFNAYIPREDGTTSELDVIMLCAQGIYVLESKNYSGWIFGKENQLKWTQTLRSKDETQKNHFYNPIMQNRKHIEVLKKYLKRNVPIKSIVVFSEHCDLKAVEVRSDDVFVIQRNKLFALVELLIDNRAAVLSSADIESVYQTLYPLTQVGETVKKAHVQDIKTH